MEICLNCRPFKSRINTILKGDTVLRDTFRVINTQFKEYKKIVADRDKELREISMELAIGITQVFEALRKISSGDINIRLNEKSNIDLISKLKHVVNLTAQEIHDSEQTMRFIQFGIDHAADSAFCIKSDAHFIYVNQAACQTLDYSQHELLSMTVHDIDPLFSKKRWSDHWQDLKKRKSFTFESLHKTKYGKTFPVEITVNFVEFEGNEYNWAFARDITARNLIQDKLKESEKKYRQLFVAETDAIIVSNVKTQHIVDANNAASRIYGYTHKEFLNKKRKHISVDPSLFEKLLRKVLSGKIVNIPLAYHRKKNGSVFPVEISAASFTSNGQKMVFAVIKDITKRKQAEDKLRDSEERFKQIAENAEEWIWEVNAEGLYTYSSPIVQRLLGYRASEIIGKKHFYDLFHPENRETLKKAALESFSLKQPFREYVNSNIHKNGKTVWLSTSGVPILDAGGNLLGYRGADTNITERKQAEEALKESEEKFRAITSTAIDAIFLLDSEGTVSYWNPAAEKMFGYKGEAALGKDLHLLLAPKRFHKEYKKGFKRFAKTGEGIAVGNTLEFSALRKDGTEFPIEVSTSALKLKNKWCSVGIVRDITDRKRAEEKIRKAELRYRTVADFTHDWEYWETPDGFLKYISPSCERITGFSPQHFAHNPNLVSEIILPEDKDIWLQHRHDTLNVQGPQSIVFRIRRKDGEIRWIDHVCQPVTDKQEMFIGVRASNRDITKRKQAEEALKKSHENLRALSLRITNIQEEERRGLTRELHDQVGQPLTALSINLDYLLEQLSGKSETTIIASLYDSKALVKKIMILIRNIIAYLRPQILDDYGLAASILWFSERFSQRTKIPVVFKGGKIKQRLPHDVETNLFRIVQESLTNISKYANASKATITLEDSGKKIRLTITDDGLGFDPSNANRKGLGLLGMRERVEAIGGILRVESSLGKGTRVIVEVKK